MVLLRHRPSNSAFTLLETVMVVGIVVLLAMMLQPVAVTALENARNAKCISNLRQMGVSLNLYLTENDGIYPRIEPNPADPVYPAGQNAKTLLETLGPYGVSEALIQCPADLAGPNRFKELGSSYQWLNFLDGDRVTNPQYLVPEGIVDAPVSRIRLVTDWDRVHFPSAIYSTASSSGGEKPTSGRRNALFADGHIGVNSGN